MTTGSSTMTYCRCCTHNRCPYRQVKHPSSYDTPSKNHNNNQVIHCLSRSPASTTPSFLFILSMVTFLLVVTATMTQTSVSASYVSPPPPISDGNTLEYVVPQPIRESRDSNNVTPKDATIKCKLPSGPDFHYGMTITPKKAKGYAQGVLVFMKCWDGLSWSAYCLADGSWTRVMTTKDCPINNGSCPDLGDIDTDAVFPPTTFENGIVRVSTPSNAPRTIKYPIDTKVKFACNEGYNLEGTPTIVCQPKFQWSYRIPRCSPADSANPPLKETKTKLIVIWTLSGVIALILVTVSLTLFFNWRRKQQQRKKWQRYFGNYTYRQESIRKSKHHILNQLRRQMDDPHQVPSTSKVIPMTTKPPRPILKITPPTPSGSHLQHHPSTSSTSTTTTTSSESGQQPSTSSAGSSSILPPTPAHIPVTDL